MYVLSGIGVETGLDRCFDSAVKMECERRRRDVLLVLVPRT